MCKTLDFDIIPAGIMEQEPLILHLKMPLKRSVLTLR